MGWLDELESFGRGAGQGATANWGDEGAAKLLDTLPKPKDPDGIGREYAAGSPEKDYLQNFRRDNAASAQAHPEAYLMGQMAGAVPAAAALPGAGAGSAAARVAASGLTGGALGGLAGAGSAEDGKRLQAAGRGALLGGVLGTGLGAAGEGLQLANNTALQQLSGVNAPVAAGAGAAPAAPSNILMRASERPAMVPPRRTSGTWDMPEIPKPSSPGFRESQIPEMENVAQAADNLTSAANKKLVERSMKKAGKPIDRDVEYLKNMADQKEAGVARRAAEEAPAPEPAAATVRPPRKKAGREPEPAPVPIQQEFADMDVPSKPMEPAKVSPELQSEIDKWSVHGYRKPSPEMVEGVAKHAEPAPVLHRGVNTSSPKEARKLASGDTWTQSKVSSWSTDPQIAADFAGRYAPVRVRVAGERGMRVVGPENAFENEVLTAPNQYDITHAAQDPSGSYNIALRPKLPAPEPAPAQVDPRQLTLDALLGAAPKRR